MNCQEKLETAIRCSDHRSAEWRMLASAFIPGHSHFTIFRWQVLQARDHAAFR